MGPVLLFHMGIILTVVSPAAGKLHRLLSFRKMSEEVVIQEFASVITIEAKQGERDRLLDIFDLFQDPVFSLAPDGPLFGPAGGDIDTIDRKGEHAHHGFTAMGHGIRFEETWPGFIPLVGLDRDLLSQQGPRFGGGSASFAILDSAGAQDAVYGGRRDRQQSLENPFRKRTELPDISGQPQGHHGLQPFGTGQVGGQPDLLQRLEDLLCAVNGRFSSFPCPGPCEALEAPQNPDRMFAMASAGGTVFIQYFRFLAMRGFFVT